MLCTIVGQAITGWDVWNQELEEMEMDPVDFWQYLVLAILLKRFSRTGKLNSCKWDN